MSKDPVDIGLLLRMFSSHLDIIKDFGAYENISRSQHVHGPGLMVLYEFLWDLVVVCPSANPKESSMRSALLELVTLRPEANNTKFNNLTWASMRTERLVCIFYHVRRLKREEGRQVQVAAKLTGQQLQKLKDLLKQVELKAQEDDPAPKEASSSCDLARSNSTVGKSPNTKVLKRHISEVSVDEDGFPMMLRSPPLALGQLSASSVLGMSKGEARARTRINNKSPPPADKPLDVALGFVVASPKAKAKAKASGKAKAKAKAKAAGKTSPLAKAKAKAKSKATATSPDEEVHKGTAARPKSKAKGNKPLEEWETASTVNYPDVILGNTEEVEEPGKAEDEDRAEDDREDEEEEEAEEDQEVEDVEEVAEVEFEPYFTSILCTKGKTPPRAYLTGIFHETKKRTLIVEVTEKKAKQYLQMIEHMKAVIEKKGLSKEEALALRAELVEAGTFS